MKFSFFLGLCALSIAAAAEQPLAIAEMNAWTIVCNGDATESEHYATSEFQRLFEGLTGKKLPIAESVPQNTGAIIIGPGAVASTGIAPITEAGEETLRITVEPNRLCIDGGRPRGTLYGVYEFFEEYCGVRFLTFDHTWYPPAVAPIATGTYRYDPPFAFRWSYYGESNRNPDFAARLRVNTVSDDAKLGGRTGYRLVGHNVAYLLPPATYGADHPEYYAMVDGSRQLEMGGGGPQLCLTNPEVLDLVTQAVLAEIEKNPGARNINVAHMDNESYCTCTECAALDAREESHAGTMINFVNQVAERVEQTHPEVLIGTYAYQYTRKPPKTLRARHNVMIQLCSIECCQFHAIDDPSCAMNRAFCEDMAIWKTKCENVFVWHYNTNFNGYMLPFPNLRSIGRSVKYFHENNGQGVFMQAAGNGFSTELSDLRNYVMARCIWKPGRDSWAEAEEFCRLHYAEAAQPILDYLTWYHDRVDQAGVHPHCFPTESSLTIDGESARAIFAYFQKAMDAAQSDAVRGRVEKASLCAYRALLSAAEMDLQYVDGLCKPDFNGIDPGILEQFAALCAKYDVSMETEHIPMAQYLETKRKLHNGLKAEKLENDIWRVVILPDYNARIVEMTYKPTGRNVARAERSLEERQFEDWLRQGAVIDWSKTQPFTPSVDGNTGTFTTELADGSTFTRRIALDGDAVKFTCMLKAAVDRPADFWVHPEFDTASPSSDPNVVAVYVKAPDWIHANSEWHEAIRNADQAEETAKAVAGGVFAFYSHEGGYGIQQTFDPKAFRDVALFWNPSRRQINLEMDSVITQLAPGESAQIEYELRYLTAPPMPPKK